ncbi:MAG: hypothetical protein IKU36_12750 [Bacteroidales bacterium]|nr:hypothetical protein [Bacteroidales bacterium]
MDLIRKNITQENAYLLPMECLPDDVAKCRNRAFSGMIEWMKNKGAKRVLQPQKNGFTAALQTVNPINICVYIWILKAF